MKFLKLFLKWIVVPALFALAGYYLVAPRLYDNNAPPPEDNSTLGRVKKELEEEQKKEAQKPQPDVEIGDAKEDKTTQGAGSDDFNRR